MNKLVIATNNSGKLVEYREMLGDLDLELVTLNQAGITDDVEEAGDSFAENAVLKAQT